MNSKEKYLFIIRTYDKTMEKEKNYLMRAKSTMDMNGWVFSINSQAFMCTENKRIYDIGKNLHKKEKSFADACQDKISNALANLEDFLYNQRNFNKILETAKQRNSLDDLFLFYLELLKVYFQAKDEKKQAKNEKDLNNSKYIEVLYNTLKKTYEHENDEIININDLVEKKIESISFPKNINNVLDLQSIMKNMMEPSEFLDKFESILKPKIYENLKKNEDFKEIFISLIGKVEKIQNFQKPFIVDLRNKNLPDNFLNATKLKHGRFPSNNDLNSSPSRKNTQRLYCSYNKLTEELKV